MSLSPDVLGHAHVAAAAAAIADRFRAELPVAAVGVILGSGLGSVADVVVERGGQAVDYGLIPHFPTSSVEGHKGRLVFGRVGVTHGGSKGGPGSVRDAQDQHGTPVLLLQGRVHRYEGYPTSSVVFPVRVLHALGVRKLVVTNAAGGIGDGFRSGDLMVIEDHLNLTGDNPLMGKNDARFGPRFPDMSEAYSHRLRKLCFEVGDARGLALQRGVYAGLLGPSYETPAEIRMLKGFGAHAVGMSTVHEVIAASHLGMEVLGLSCVTNLAAGLSSSKLSHDEVKETATRVEKEFSGLVLDLLPRMP
ncbi:MAG: purine-nucleoside phosphorylase [Deltaproteobacteria bacterium]|nr:purine-nucleoside phosphorylase [Deltaproteobacteria bacterium]